MIEIPEKESIPHIINLTTTDPFLIFLVTVYNNGINYMTEASERYEVMIQHQNDFDEFIKNNKLNGTNS